MMLDRLGIVDTLGLSVGSRITRQRSYLSNLIVEVTNWETDYACKAEEYGLLSIPDLNPGLPGARWNCLYWSLNQPTLTVCQLVDRDYRQQHYHLGQLIVVSRQLPCPIFLIHLVRLGKAQ
jgi:hypothetical protein